MNYILDISFGQPAYPLVRYLHSTSSHECHLTQVYQVASNFEESYLSSTCSRAWTRSEWTEWTFESESSATKNPETATKSQFCCEHRTIVEDWRGMVVVNWMMFWICFNDAHDLYRTERILVCNPLRVEKKSDIPWCIIRIFIHGPEPMEGFGLGFLSGISIHTLESPGIPRSRYAQIPSTDDLQQRSTTTQVAPWRTEKNPQVECWTGSDFFQFADHFFLTLLVTLVYP